MPNIPDKKRTLLKALLAKEGIQAGAAIPQRPEGVNPLSFAQERLWYLTQISPDNAAYNIPAAYRLRGELDVAALEAALNAVIERHEILRARFPDGDRPAQIIAGRLRISVLVLDVPAEKIEEQIKMEARAPFDLAAGPPVRARLLRISAREHVFLLTLHHIVGDGWSFAVLLREVSSLYNAAQRGESAHLPPLRIQYADFAHWQRRQDADESIRPQIDYWREQLAGEIETIELPSDHSRPPVQSFDGRWVEHILPAGLGEAAGALARSEAVTLLNVALTAFNVLLGRYTGQEDVVVGTPVTTRTRVEFENLIGHFVNTQALRTDLSGRPTFRRLLGRVRSTLVDAYANQEVAFERLLESLDIPRDPGKSPLFQIVFILQDTPAHANWRTALRLDGLQIEPVFTHSDTAKFDLTVEIEELPQGLTLSMEYNADLFEEAAIRRMAGHYETLLGAALGDPDAGIDTLPMLTAEETAELAAWNDTGTAYPRERTIRELFEEQVARAPDAAALRFKGREMSYAELNRFANRVAAELLALGVEADSLVGIACERSFELIAGILGILKAGAAFVPLDMNYPAARIAFMLEDTGARVVLIQDHLREAIEAAAPSHTRLLSLDALASRDPSGRSPNPAVRSSADSLAYVMYTSGSTGRPKGVAIPQRGVVRLVQNTNYAVQGPDQISLQFSPISFDASTLEIWGALLNGGRLVIPPPGRLSFEALGELIRQEGISLLFLTSGLFSEMVESCPQGLSGVQQIITGGDVVSPGHARTMLSQMQGGQLTNAYGPTENTTFTTTYPVDALESTAAALPIGRPVSNTTAYILDGDLNPVPVGVVGELYTGGDGLARGYLNRPALTAERFIPDPFAGSGGRMYRTGDLARRRPDGVIEFLGRRDSQVKLRGFRIELGEIEAALRALPGVREGVVIVKGRGQPGDKQLVGYVIPESGGTTIDALRAGLSAGLPEYMVPASFVFVDSFPLTENGKLDRRALPEPSGERPDLGTAFQPPQTAAERTITAIWRQVLEIERVGLDDNFFDLGGHSLLMLQVHNRLKAEFNRDIPMIRMFSHPTVRSMARRLSRPASSEPDGEALRSRGAARRARRHKRNSRSS